MLEIYLLQAVVTEGAMVAAVGSSRSAADIVSMPPSASARAGLF